jgi:hypothetical protein
LVLARLRWIQRRPISTCVVLSVFVHILLVGSAYMTKLIQAPPGTGQDETIQFVVSTDRSADRPDEPMSEEPKPWQTAPSDDLDLPSPSELQRSPMETAAPVQREAVNHIPSPSATISSETRPVEQPDVPQQADLAVLSNNHLSLAADAAPITSEFSEEPPDVSGEPIDDGSENAGVTPGPAEPDDIRPAESEKTDAAHNQLVDAPRTAEHADVASDTIDNLVAVDPFPAGTEPGEAATSAAHDDRGPTTPRGESVGSSATPHVRSSHGDPARDGPSNGCDAVRTLVNGQPVPELYRLRVQHDRFAVAQRRGANVRTEAAVQSALRWLVATQSEDGRWDASATGGGTERQIVEGHDRGGAGAEADMGISGLACLAFLGAGHTHLDGEHRQTVQHGLEFLIGNQRYDGSMAGAAEPFAAMYCHGIASLAISEAYAMTRDPRLEPYVRRAVDYTVSAQHRTTGGWRYHPGDLGDTSQFGWQLMALKSAELGGIPVPEQTRFGMQRFLASVSTGQFGGLAGYRPGWQSTRSMTAEALVCRLFMGGTAEPTLAEAADFVSQQPPGVGSANFYYWYYATLGLCCLDNDHWRRWNSLLQNELLASQIQEGPATGSWAPETVWGGYGGRVYTTALAALCLEVYYRYMPMHASLVSQR